MIWFLLCLAVVAAGTGLCIGFAVWEGKKRIGLRHVLKGLATTLVLASLSFAAGYAVRKLLDDDPSEERVEFASLGGAR